MQYLLLPGDLKIVALLVGLQQGYTKYIYFLHVSEWDGRVRELIYLRKEWTRRQNAVREKSIHHPALMSRQNPATTSGPMKNFVKAMDRTSPVGLSKYAKRPIRLNITCRSDKPL